MVPGVRPARSIAAEHSYVYYPIAVTAEKRDDLRHHLLRHGIDTKTTDMADCAVLDPFREATEKREGRVSPTEAALLANGDVRRLVIDPSEFDIPPPPAGALRGGDAAENALAELMQMVVDLDGTLTGEHGIGITKSEFVDLEIPPAEKALMEKIKSLFDPNNILNPGKIFTNPKKK